MFSILQNLFTLHLSFQIPCVYRHFGRWRVISNSSPALHHSSPGLKIDRKMCILLYALMCRSIWVKSEEYFRVCFHIIFIGQDYDMTTHLPDFCEPSLRMIWSSCIFLRCLRMALLLMFRVLAISREVIFPLLAIRCKMAFLVSGPPFWTTFLDHLFFPFCPLLHSVKIRRIFWFCKKKWGII